MDSAPPVELRSSQENLLSLASDVTGFGTRAPFLDDCIATEAWFTMRSGEPLVTWAEDDCSGGMMDVFTLSICTPGEALSAAKENRAHLEQSFAGEAENVLSMFGGAPSPEQFRPPEDMRPWPFEEWRLDVLQRRDRLAEGPLPPDTPDFDIDSLQPSEVPPGTTLSCLVAVGLLFTGADGRRLLVATADGYPTNLLITEHPERIEEYLFSCFVIPVASYAARRFGA